jgi:hypothetical protein
MSSLEACMAKIKGLNKEDKNAIRRIRDDLDIGDITRDQANEQAVVEYMLILEQERQSLMEAIEAAGGVLSDVSNAQYSKMTVQEREEMQQRIFEQESRKFIRKGTRRPRPETVNIDYKTGKQLPKGFENNATPEQMKQYGFTKELRDERTWQSVEEMFGGFFWEHPRRVLDIVQEFNPEAALKLAKAYGLVKPRARKLNLKRLNKKRVDEINQTVNKKFSGASRGDKWMRKTEQAIVPMSDWFKNSIDKIRVEYDLDPVPELIRDDNFNNLAADIILDWLQENENLPMRWRMDKVAAEFAEKHSDHPTAVVTKYAGVTLEAESKEPGKTQFWTHLKKMKMPEVTQTLSIVPLTKLKDFIRFGMQHTKLYVFTNKRMDAFMNVRVDRHAAIAKDWLNLTVKKWRKGSAKMRKGAKVLGELMHASTLTGVDMASFKMPDEAAWKKMSKKKRKLWKQKQIDYNKLRKFWNQLGDPEYGGDMVTYQKEVFKPDETTTGGKWVPEGEPMEVTQAQALYMRVRDTYENSRTELIYNLERRIENSEADRNTKGALIARLRKEFEAGLITPYFPLKRFGVHWATARDPETGEVVSFIKRERGADRDAWAEEMRRQGWVVTASQAKASDYDAMNSVDAGFVADIVGLVKDSDLDQAVLDKEGNKIPGSSLTDAIWQMYLSQLPEMSSRKAYMTREGRAGFATDALRSFSEHTFHDTHQAAKLRFGQELNFLVTSAQREADELQQRYSHIQNLRRGWRPEKFEKTASIHDVLMADPGFRDYAKLYAKLRGQALGKGNATFAGVHEPSAKAALLRIEAQAKEDGPWAVPLADELLKRHAYVMNPRAGKLSTEITKWGFMWFLSTSPAAAALNLTQTPISGFPTLRAEFKGQDVAKALFDTSKEFAAVKAVNKKVWHKGYMPGVFTHSAVEGYMNKLKNDKGKDGKELDIGEKAALQYFEEIGMFSKTRTRELQGMAEAGGKYQSESDQWVEWAGYMFHKSEEFNRVVTGMAAYRLARDKLTKQHEGDKTWTPQAIHHTAAEMAFELVEISHYDYTNTNRPRVMQSDGGRVVFLFRNFSLNMHYRLLRDFKEGYWDVASRAINKRTGGKLGKDYHAELEMEDIKKARTRFLGMLGMASLYTGMQGMPMWWLFKAVVETMWGSDDDPYDLEADIQSMAFNATKDYVGEFWGETIADAIMRGPVTAFTTFDLSQRASLNNLWLRDIPYDKKKGDTLIPYLLAELGGPTIGFLHSGWQGINELDDHPYRGLEKIVPKALSDVMKSIRYATQGATTYGQDVILTPEQVTLWGSFVQAMGFSYSPLSRLYKQNRDVREQSRRLEDRHKFLMDLVFRARANPRWKIDLTAINQSADQRREYDRLTVQGLYLPKRLQYLQQDMRYTRIRRDE